MSYQYYCQKEAMQAVYLNRDKYPYHYKFINLPEVEVVLDIEVSDLEEKDAIILQFIMSKATTSTPKSKKDVFTDISYGIYPNYGRCSYLTSNRIFNRQANGVLMECLEDISETNYSQEYEYHPKANEIIDNGWSCFVNMDIPYNSMVISDDYLLNNMDSIINIGNLISKKYNSESSQKFQVLLRADKDEVKIDLELAIETIKNIVSQNENLVIEILTTKDIHKRVCILNNSSYVFDKGFKLFKNDQKTINADNSIWCQSRFKSVLNQRGVTALKEDQDILSKVKKLAKEVEESVSKGMDITIFGNIVTTHGEKKIINRLLN